MCDRSSSGSTSGAAPDSRLYCDGCRRSFSRPQDKARHSCRGVRLRRAAGSVNISVSKIVLKTLGYGKAQMF